MGKIPILTKEQRLILDQVKQNEFLRSNFYFTGGTALSGYYLNHRESEDLDFFSQKKFDPQVFFTLMEKWGKKHKFKFEFLPKMLKKLTLDQLKAFFVDKAEKLGKRVVKN